MPLSSLPVLSFPSTCHTNERGEYIKRDGGIVLLVFVLLLLLLLEKEEEAKEGREEGERDSGGEIA